MSGETIVTIVGNVTQDPDLRFISNGAPVVNFSVASQSRFYNKNSGQWEDGQTLFFRCSAWRAQAENIAASVKKGTRVIVQGELAINTFTKQDGSTGTSVEIKNAEVAASLKYAKCQIEKNPPGSGQDYQSFGNQNQQGSGYGGYGQAPHSNDSFGSQSNYDGARDSNAGDAWGQSSNSDFDSGTPPF